MEVNLLRGITDLIVHAANPDAVVLFGSYAKGMQNVDSDIDIIVIADGLDSRLARDQELKGLLHRYLIRIDVHMVGVQELALAQSAPRGFLSSALASGALLYASERGTRLLTPWLASGRSKLFGET
jgi:predicted nucleotidyltransferase